MAQSDLNIANADGATVRADINSQLEALATQNSGPTAPPVTFPFMRWFDTASNQLKRRNGANTAWRTALWEYQPIGVPFGIRDDLAGSDVPPTDDPLYRYIKLTASDAYNTGALTSESVSGSAPLVVATAVIDYTDSPINGETVNLWNTEGRYGKPGTSPGSVGNDQMQQITGTLIAAGNANVGSFSSSTGALSVSNSTTGRNEVNSASSRFTDASLDSANSPGARAGAYTDVKHQQLTYYMRIA